MAPLIIVPSPFNCRDDASIFGCQALTCLRLDMQLSVAANPAKPTRTYILNITGPGPLLHITDTLSGRVVQIYPLPCRCFDQSPHSLATHPSGNLSPCNICHRRRCCTDTQDNHNAYNGASCEFVCYPHAPLHDRLLRRARKLRLPLRLPGYN